MESDIKIKCTVEEMEELFDTGGDFSVRHYQLIAPGLFQCKIHHRELRKKLSGTYTIQDIRKILK